MHFVVYPRVITIKLYRDMQKFIFLFYFISFNKSPPRILYTFKALKKELM